MTESVLVTGSSGLLGQAVVADLLAAGCEVVGADRVPTAPARQRLLVVEWDGREVLPLQQALR
jgi:uncharacterized protein YbjT (DUF2867 family)